jgi:WD40 repeat protein
MVAALSPDNRLIALHGSARNRYRISVWDIERRELRASFHTVDYFSRIAFSRDSKSIAVVYWRRASKDHSLRVYGAASLKLQRELPTVGGESAEIVFSKDGRSLYAASADGDARQWDYKTGRLLREFRIPAPGKSPAPWFVLAALTAVWTVLWFRLPADPDSVGASSDLQKRDQWLVAALTAMGLISGLMVHAGLALPWDSKLGGGLIFVALAIPLCSLIPLILTDAISRFSFSYLTVTYSLVFCVWMTMYWYWRMDELR